MSNTINYLLNKATEYDICDHLLDCDTKFVQTLRERVDIGEYSSKICNKAVRFEAWENGTLVGLVAAYCNDQVTMVAYITSVSVLPQWKGKGIAAQLIDRCIGYARNHGMNSISLEVAHGNAPAIGLYEKYGFVVVDATVPMITMNLSFKKGKKDGEGTGL